MKYYIFSFFAVLLFNSCSSSNSQLKSIEALSEQAILFSSTLDQQNIKYDCSFEGLLSIEQYLESLTIYEQSTLRDQTASYLGECIIKSYGGTWEKQKETGWAIKFAEETYVFPFSSVQQHIENPETDSFSSLYSMIPILIEIQEE